MPESHMMALVQIRVAEKTGQNFIDVLDRTLLEDRRASASMTSRWFLAGSLCQGE